MALAAVTAIAAGSQLIPATARADLHNITYRARIDGVAPGSQATFIITDNQRNTAGLSSVPGTVFEASAVLDDPQKAGLRITLRWPYSANVHCEIDVEDQVFTQIDQVVRTAPGSSDPTNGVLQCGTPITG